MTLKHDLAQVPALVYPQVEEPFILQLASTDVALGAAPLQKQSTGKLQLVTLDH